MPSTTTRLTAYQKKLFVFLSVATFFEGYDFLAITQILPNLRQQMDMSVTEGGMLVAFVNGGAILAYLLVRRADQWGRRRLLMVTVAGYTVMSFATGLAWSPSSFAVFQLLARIFLIAEWATSMVYAAEEFPAERRGMVIGVIQAFGSLGSVVCAALVPYLLATFSTVPPALEALVPSYMETSLGWRSVYFAGTIPLLLLAYGRRHLKETQRFQAQGPSAARTRRPLTFILKTPYRRRVLQLALIWGLTYICTQNAVTFWKEFALAERGFTDAQVGKAIAFAAVVSMPLLFGVGKLLDRIGRRRGAVVIYLAATIGVYGSYTFQSPTALTAALVFAIFGATAVLPVMNAYNTELFPTDLRGDAFAWANNLLGRIGYVLGPLAVGFAADSVGWGPAVATTAVFPIAALLLILMFLPETSGRELEETSRL